ncbi:hypothetical protein ACM77C_04625 [Pseudomonas aeruginosa]
MTKANECTCPSGDGSLRHPCPAHPAVEQAGGDERDLQGTQGERDGWGPFPIVQVPWNVFDRAVMWVEDRRRYGDDGTIVDDWKALKTIQRAALAQPSPAPEIPERGTQHRFSTNEQNCRHDFAGVWWNDNGETKTGRECRHCGFFVADVTEAAAEQAEAERPEQPKRHTADVFYHNHFSTVQMEVVRASDFDEFAAQHERIVGALRAEIAEWQEAAGRGRSDVVAYIAERAKLLEGRDAALARVAELDKQCRDDVARALGLRPSQERGFAWSYLLASIKSCVKASEDAAQAQHSVPDDVETFLDEVRAELLRARSKFPGDRIMTIALAEEFGELCKAVLDEPAANVRKEAVQTAVMAARVVLDGDGSVTAWRAERGLDPLAAAPGKEGL